MLIIVMTLCWYLGQKMANFVYGIWMVTIYNLPLKASIFFYMTIGKIIRKEGAYRVKLSKMIMLNNFNVIFYHSSS